MCLLVLGHADVGPLPGNPMAAHLRLKTVRPEHFQRWLGLFGETARELFAAELAEAFIGRAEAIARSLQLGMFYRPGTSTAHPETPS